MGARVLCIFRTDSGRGCGEEEVDLRAGSTEVVVSSWERGGIAHSVSICPPMHLPQLVPQSTSACPEKLQTQVDSTCLFPDYSSF